MSYYKKVKSPFYFVVCYYPFVTGGTGKRLPCGGLQIGATTLAPIGFGMHKNTKLVVSI